MPTKSDLQQTIHELQAMSRVMDGQVRELEDSVKAGNTANQELHSTVRQLRNDLDVEKRGRQKDAQDAFNLRYELQDAKQVIEQLEAKLAAETELREKYQRGLLAVALRCE